MSSPCDQDAIKEFLEAYGQALSTGDLAGIVRCWAVPALVLSDQGVRLVLAATEIEEFFGQAVAWYHAQGMAETRPDQVRVEALGERLCSVDVTWASLDGAGAERSRESSRYILLLSEDGQPQIRVAISIQLAANADETSH